MTPTIRTMYRLGATGLLAGVFALSGCSVFQPVGDFFAQGYRNSVSYFNAYYNASRLFDAAVAEIDQAQRVQRPGPSAVQPANVAAGIPSSARQKLNSVIDKCSNILAFHAKSDYVDDALLLIARSYFLQGEYVKSERKCAELLAQFPSSELANEARILYGRVLTELSRPEEAQALLTEGLAVATAGENKEQRADALEALSSLRRKVGDIPGALQYATQLREIAPDDESVGAAMLREAQLLVEQGRPEAALEPLTSIPQATEDPLIVYDAGLLHMDALRDLKRYPEALDIADEMTQDLRFKDRLGPVALERARLLNDAGRVEEAIAAYDYADTAFARQASAAEAAYELGMLYERQLQDYATAAKKYERSAAAGAFPISVQARRRSSMFTRYFQLQKGLAAADSLRHAADMSPRDSTGARTNAALLDSLTTQVAITMQDLGEWFYSELEQPDSSRSWLRRSLEMERRHRNTPRGWFLLADLERPDSSRASGVRDSLLRRIIDEYPESPYAAEARKILGIETVVTHDRSDQLYREAESAMDAGSFELAARRFDSVMTLYPSSPLAAKSVYAAGWTYDNRLDRPDSAAARYRSVIRLFGSTEYAEPARRRLTQLTPVKADSAAAPVPSPRPVEESGPTLRPSPAKDADRVRPAATDTARAKVIE